MDHPVLFDNSTKESTAMDRNENLQPGSMDQTCIDTADSLLGDSSNNYLSYGTQMNSKVRQPSFFTFDPVPATSGSQHFASSMSGSTDPIHLRVGPDFSIDPYYYSDFRRNPRLTGFGLGDAHSPFNNLSSYDDGLFSGESYRPFLNRPFFPASFASSPSYSEPAGECQDRESIFHESSVPTTPTLLQLRPQRTQLAMGTGSLTSGSSQITSPNAPLMSANSPLGSVNSQLPPMSVSHAPSAAPSNPPLGSVNSTLGSVNSSLASVNPPLQWSSNPSAGSPTSQHASPSSIQRMSPSTTRRTSPSSLQRTSPHPQRSQRYGSSRASQNSPQRTNGRYSSNRSHGTSPAMKDMNTVHLEDVESGKDKRTTLMIKNIPNAFSRETILSIIDSYCKNQYDFFYLPIDQKTNCNLGYGYINMVDLESVIRLYKEFNGKKWTNTRSVKVCSICYGRLQSGIENLVEYCSDWSVMTSDEKYHPLFFKPVHSIVEGVDVITMERYIPKVSLSMKNN